MGTKLKALLETYYQEIYKVRLHHILGAHWSEREVFLKQA